MRVGNLPACALRSALNVAAHAMQRAHAALTDLRPQPDDITADALAGLSQTPKTLPSKYFYDARGSQLFEAITQQPEYYLTRTELSLLEASMGSIAQAIGAGVHVVEYGSGSGRKTELLLQGLRDVVAYTPLEISRTALLESTARLAQQFPQIQMLPVCTDFANRCACPMRSARRGGTWCSSPARRSAISPMLPRSNCWMRCARPWAATVAP